MRLFLLIAGIFSLLSGNLCAAQEEKNSEEVITINASLFAKELGNKGKRQPKNGGWSDVEPYYLSGSYFHDETKDKYGMVERAVKNQRFGFLEFEEIKGLVSSDRSKDFVRVDISKDNLEKILAENGEYFDLTVSVTPFTSGYSESEYHYYYSFKISKEELLLGSTIDVLAYRVACSEPGSYLSYEIFNRQ